jgi:hypothetical protein
LAHFSASIILSFLYNLESFFWFLFWICINWNGPGKGRKEKKLRNLIIGTTNQSRNLRVLKPEKYRSRTNLKKNFNAYCKPLIPYVQELRKVVFPGGKWRLEEDRELHSRMKAVLEKARDDLGARKVM